MTEGEALLQRDRRVTWHPYTQHGVEAAPLPVVAAEGAWLQLADGRRVLDGISSWWAILHGHCEPRLVAALREQAGRLDHVLFAGATHEPAVQLAERLLQVVPKGLSRVFYSDDGSTAVEVALKIVLQGFAQHGEPERRVFVALDGAYHGDTFGAMAASDPDPFFVPFAPLLFRVRRVSATSQALEAALDELGRSCAGVLLEPLLQGAAGMRLVPAEFVRAVREACTQRGLPLIADEVMTGFGRTGSLFACELAGVAPDLMCVAKGLTGGMLPLAATLATEAWFERFLHGDRSRYFAHGHTFTANPLACAVAVRSLALCHEHDVPARLQRIGSTLFARLRELRSHPQVLDLRHLGGMVAIELRTPAVDAGYGSSLAPQLRAAALARGVLLRPLGNVLYALPPACLDDGETNLLADVMHELVVDVAARLPAAR